MKLPSFLAPGPQLAFVDYAAVRFSFQQPLFGDQAPSSDASEPLTPKNATFLIRDKPAVNGV